MLNNLSLVCHFVGGQ